MDNFKVNLDNVAKEFTASKIYKLADVQDNIEKIGCDLVRFVDENNKVGLWKIIRDEKDDSEYIVSMYDEESENIISNSWSIEKDKFNKTATIYYKTTPITNIIFSELGIPEMKVDSFLKNLPERISKNKEVVYAMLNNVDVAYKKDLIKQYPEIL